MFHRISGLRFQYSIYIYSLSFTSFIYCSPPPRTREPRGFAFVRFLRRDDAEDAMSTMNNKEFDGRVLTVNFAENKKQPFVPRDGGGYQGRDRYNDRGRDDRRRDKYDDRDRERERDRSRDKYDDRRRDKYDDRRKDRERDRSRDRRRSDSR